MDLANLSGDLYQLKLIGVVAQMSFNCSRRQKLVSTREDVRMEGRNQHSIGLCGATLSLQEHVVVVYCHLYVVLQRSCFLLSYCRTPGPWIVYCHASGLQCTLFTFSSL